MSQIYNENTKVPKPKENQVGILGISSREFMDSVGNSAEGLEFRRECCWGYVSIFENFVSFATIVLSDSGKGAI